MLKACQSVALSAAIWAGVIAAISAGLRVVMIVAIYQVLRRKWFCSKLWCGCCRWCPPGQGMDGTFSAFLVGISGGPRRNLSAESIRQTRERPFHAA